MFAKDRVLLTLKALQEHFSLQMSTSASANTKESSAKTKVGIDEVFNEILAQAENFKINIETRI